MALTLEVDKVYDVTDAFNLSKVKLYKVLVDKKDYWIVKDLSEGKFAIVNKTDNISRFKPVQKNSSFIDLYEDAVFDLEDQLLAYKETIQTLKDI